MHLNIGLPLLSELEQLRRAFWLNHNHQNHSHNQDKTLDSQEQTAQKQSSDTERHLDNANNHTEPNHLTQSQNQNSTPDSHSDREQSMCDNHDTRTERDHSCLSTECKDCSQNKSQTCCRSMSTDSGENGSYEHKNPSRQSKAQDEPSPPLQVNNSLIDQINRPRRTSRVLWDRSTEDSSFL